MKSGKKTKEAHIRFTADEYARVQVQAKAARKSASAFVHDSALNESHVHITDGKQVAEKLGKLHNQMILCHNDIRACIQSLQGTVDAQMKLVNSSYTYSGKAQEMMKMLDMQINAAVNVIQNAYSGYENRVEEALHTVLPEISQTGGK